MALLTKNQIVQADDIKHRDVEVPEWGGTVRVRGLTARERSLIEATMVAVKGENVTVRVEALATLRERLVGASLVDENNERLFSDREILDLSKKSGAVLQRLFDVAQELSGMDKKAIASAEGNFVAARSASSDSA